MKWTSEFHEQAKMQSTAFSNIFCADFKGKIDQILKQIPHLFSNMVRYEPFIHICR